jgi:ribosomal protein S18 acetylase RimI-like enzyme
MWTLADIKDDEKIVMMCRELNREDPGSYPVPESHTRKTLICLREQPVRGRALVYKIAGSAQAYAFLISFWSNEVGGQICFIDELFVMPEFRNRGISKELISALIAGNHDFWPGERVALDLEVTPDNQRARGLYTRLGFKPARNANMRMRFNS